MESSNQLSDSKTSYTAGQASSISLAMPQIPPSFSESSLVGLKGNAEPTEVSGHQHPRWASDFFIEDQPFWLEDLLNEPDTPAQRGHQRSTSDTFAYLGEAVEELDIGAESNHKNVTSKNSSFRQNIVHFNIPDQIKFEIRSSSQDESFKKDSNVAISGLAEKHDKEESSSQNPEGSMEGTSSSPPKTSVSKTDAKRAKQQSAHRSRVRKLQYISQLERTIELMQAEGSEISAELEFLDHQNLILSMENKALKQRLDSLTQEQLIKRMEQEMLERELGRLKNMYQLQRQQQLQIMQQQQQHNHKHRRNKNKDHESPLSSISRKNVRSTI